MSSTKKKILNFLQRLFFFVNFLLNLNQFFNYFLDALAGFCHARFILFDQKIENYGTQLNEFSFALFFKLHNLEF